MVKSEETCLFRSNCFVRMTSADHEVTTGKSAPWGGWNEISYQPTCSSSLLHFVPFVICKAKEMFCSPWFFFHRFFPREKKKTMHLTGFSKVSAPASGLFGPSFRGEWLRKRSSTPLSFSLTPDLISPTFRELENPRTLCLVLSHGKRTSITVANVTSYKLLPPQKRHWCLGFKAMVDKSS